MYNFHEVTLDKIYIDLLSGNLSINTVLISEKDNLFDFKKNSIIYLSIIEIAYPFTDKKNYVLKLIKVTCSLEKQLFVNRWSFSFRRTWLLDNLYEDKKKKKILV